ncbi:MAG: phage scaffolding protein [Blautia sp.]|jgi:predicted  nucleic acid-binding Zn-ribbon protein
MKRSFLEAMGLEKEQIDKIMDENSADIGKAKQELESVQQELESTKEQLSTANKTIEGLGDYDQVKAKVEEYKSKYEQSKTEYEQKIADMQFSSSLESAISAAGARSIKAVRALLDVDALKQSKDLSADIKAALEACQKENDYLFGVNEPIRNPVGPTGGPVIGITKEEFRKLGYKERLDLKQKDPRKYDELKGEQ